MRVLRRLQRRENGSAAVEMALVLPLLLGIMFGSVELGNYFLSEHKLVKGVRDGARFASRQNFANYSACSGDVPAEGTSGSVFENTKLMVRKGTLSSTADDLIPNWDDATFDMTVTCATDVAAGEDADGNPVTAPMEGIYSGNTTGAPVVTVTASVPYTPVLASFGFNANALTLNASQQSAVMGI